MMKNLKEESERRPGGGEASAEPKVHVSSPSVTLRLQGTEIKKEEDFKYLESTGHVDWRKKKCIKWQKRMQGTTAEVSSVMDNYSVRNFDFLLKVQCVQFGFIYDFIYFIFIYCKSI